MSPAFLYAAAGALLFCMGLLALAVRPHLLHKVLAVNVAGSGVFLVYIAMAYRGGAASTDPVPQAMVLTGIVIAVSTTALALVLALKLQEHAGAMQLDGEEEEGAE